jgi:heme-degrading monooxygenase HmoA
VRRSADGEADALPPSWDELWQAEATAMFSVIFEVHPKQEKFDLYLELAKGLRPILEGIDGFIDNERFESTRRPGWILSHSTWRDEKSVVRWRTVGKHHEIQQRGRDEVFQDYHLRVGEIVADTAPRSGAAIVEQRLDETEIGRAKFMTLTEVPPESGKTAVALPDWLSLDRRRGDLVDYDLFASPVGLVARPVFGREVQPARVCRPPPSDRARCPRLRDVRSTRESAILPGDTDGHAAERKLLISGHQKESKLPRQDRALLIRPSRR